MIKFLYNYASVIVFDYRSYGRSNGNDTNLSIDNLNKDAESIWKYTINEFGINPNDISIVGESIGCTIAIELVANISKMYDSEFYPHSIILNCPIYSLESLLQKYKLGFIGKMVSYLTHEYQSNISIQYINHITKIIIAHSIHDKIIPYTEGYKLYEEVSKVHPKVKFINLTGSHNHLGLTDDYIYTLADLFYD